MQDLNPKQINKLKKIAAVIDKGNVGILEYMSELEDKIDEKVSSFEEAVSKVAVKIKGDKGERGKDGKAFYGADGKDGKDGKDGISIQGKAGKDGKDGKDGKPGERGEDGLDGLDGKDGERGKDGKDGRDGKDGKDGKTPLVGWGAHPLRVEASGVMKTKVARTLNFIGATVVQKGTGVTDITITGGVGGSGTVTSVTSATAELTVADTTVDPIITIVSAPKLTTARTIAGVSFDGTANISLNNNAITNGAGYITSVSGQNHNSLSNLTTGDVHTQYAFLAGRAGGQTLIGGTGTTDDLILRTTSGVGATGADMIFQGGNNGATEFGRFLNSGNFSVGSNAIYVNAASKFLGINTATHESCHLRIVTTSTQGIKMTRTAPFTSSEFRVDLSGSGAEVVATGSGGSSVIRGFVSGATQAYISAGHLAVGATAGAARIHSTWTGGAQFRAEYNSTNYWTLTENVSGTTTYNAQGTTPIQRFALNGIDVLTLTPGQAIIYGSSPFLQLSDTLGYGLLVSAGSTVGGKAGIYEAGASSVIADYDYVGGIFNYAAGNLTYDAVGGIVYSYVPFNAPDVQAVTLTASGNAVFNANVQVTGLVTGVGAPATILTNFNLYVDTATGLVYVD